MSRSIPLICSGHSRPVPDASYSAINGDGFFLISACLDGKPMLRNGETGDWIGTFEGHKGAVWAARLNHNATIALTASADYTAKLWDAISGSELRTFTHKRIVKSCDFSRSGLEIVTGGQDKILRVWDAEHGQLKNQFEGHQDTIKQVLYMKNSDFLILSGGADQVIRMWDTRSGMQVSTAFAKSSVASLELSPDSRLLTSAAGKEVTFWDAATLVPIKMYTLSVELNSASLHPASTKFVAGGADFHLHLYDYTTGEEIEVHKGHHGPVHCVRFAPDGETYCSGSEDGTVRLWQTSPKSYGLWQVNANGVAVPPSGTTPTPTPSTPTPPLPSSHQTPGGATQTRR